MDIYATLKADHRIIKDFLRQLDELGDSKPRTREKLASQFRAFVEAHSKAEEKVFYRPLLRHESAKDQALEGDVEHEVVATLLLQLESTDPEDPRWRAYLAVIRESLEHHIEEEEKDIFQKARKVLETEAENDIGDAMEVVRNNLLSDRGFPVSEYH